MADRSAIAPGDIIQAVPSHKWGGALLIVDQSKDWGVVAYLRVPKNDGTSGNAFICLAHDEFEPVGARALVQRDGERVHG